MAEAREIYGDALWERLNRPDLREHFPLNPCKVRSQGRYAGQRRHVYIHGVCILCKQVLP